MSRRGGAGRLPRCAGLRPALAIVGRPRASSCGLSARRAGGPRTRRASRNIRLEREDPERSRCPGERHETSCRTPHRARRPRDHRPARRAWRRDGARGPGPLRGQGLTVRHREPRLLPGVAHRPAPWWNTTAESSCCQAVSCGRMGGGLRQVTAGHDPPLAGSGLRPMNSPILPAPARGFSRPRARRVSAQDPRMCTRGPSRATRRRTEAPPVSRSCPAGWNARGCSLSAPEREADSGRLSREAGRRREGLRHLRLQRGRQASCTWTASPTWSEAGRA